ncbi:DNA polymerase III subunit epsilon [Rickettsiales bacterium]|nr:DNA polymerase III subunit epsilon [Rickettsiales bacterium]
MRKIILDTETTGLNPVNDRIIEIACLELMNEIPTGKVFHKYFNPGDVIIPEQAENIHGLSNEFLKNYELFDNKVEEVLDFIDSSQLVIHNASFDLAMINNSLNRMNLKPIEISSALCTVIMARKMFPGSKVNLNALCRRFDISLENRKKHDALTDCFLLSQVYLELIGGKQHKFSFRNEAFNKKAKQNEIDYSLKKTSIISLSENEITNHESIRKKIRNSIWSKINV